MLQFIVYLDIYSLLLSTLYFYILDIQRRQLLILRGIKTAQQFRVGSVPDIILLVTICTHFVCCLTFKHTSFLLPCDCSELQILRCFERLNVVYNPCDIIFYVIQTQESHLDVIYLYCAGASILWGWGS